MPAGELDYAKTQTAKIEFALDWAIAHLGTTIRKLQEGPRSDADSACVDALWQGYKCLQKGPRKWLERAELGYLGKIRIYHQSGRGHLLKKLAKSLHKARALLIQGRWWWAWRMPPVWMHPRLPTTTGTRWAADAAHPRHPDKNLAARPAAQGLLSLAEAPPDQRCRVPGVLVLAPGGQHTPAAGATRPPFRLAYKWSSTTKRGTPPWKAGKPNLREALQCIAHGLEQGLHRGDPFRL